MTREEQCARVGEVLEAYFDGAEKRCEPYGNGHINDTRLRASFLLLWNFIGDFHFLQLFSETQKAPKSKHRKAFYLKAHEKLPRRGSSRLSLEGLLNRYFK